MAAPSEVELALHAGDHSRANPTVLEALAAPGVSLAIRALANNPSVILSGSGSTMELNADQRAALRVLADAAKDTP